MRRAAILLYTLSSLHAATAPLAIVQSTISDTEDGPPVPSSFTFVPGQFLFLNFNITGYKAAGDQKIHITAKIDAFDSKHVRLMETAVAVIDTTLADEDKNWKPIVRQQILLPPLAGSGKYQIAIQLKDDLSGGETRQEMPFTVHGREVDPSDTLIARNFHFYRSEEDAQALVPPSYKPGATLWARFDIVGYKFGRGNAIDVDYGISVIAPSGKVLYTVEKAAEEKSASFYPKAYVPGSMNLSIQSTIHPGQYSIGLTVRDHIGNQTYEAKETFTIE